MKRPHRENETLLTLFVALSGILLACSAESSTALIDPNEQSAEEQKRIVDASAPDLCSALGECLGLTQLLDGSEETSLFASCSLALGDLPLLDAFCDLDACAGWLASSTCGLSLLSSPIDACACLDLAGLLGTIQGVLGPILMAGGTLQELLGLGLSLHQLLRGGLSVEALLQGGVPLAELLAEGVPILDLLAAQVPLAELLAEGVPILDLLAAQVPLAELLAEGVGLVELLLAGITQAELLAEGVPLDAILAALLQIGG